MCLNPKPRSGIVSTAMIKTRRAKPCSLRRSQPLSRCGAWLALGLGFSILSQSATLQAASLKAPGRAITITNSAIVIHPINHATLVMVSGDRTIYVDPVGERSRFAGLPRPDLVLVTDIHEDHLSTNTLEWITTDRTIIIAPSVVKEKLSEKLQQRTSAMANGETNTFGGVTIEAVPMYNLTPDRLKFHEKGRGNGYIVTAGEKRVYISGDTEDIPEMRNLKNIDAAFVCMNLPFTMTVEQAASAVREFKPKIVCPYHCQGSDLDMFKNLVGEDAGIVVQLREWYR